MPITVETVKVLIGVLTGFVARSVTAPLEKIKIQLQCQDGDPRVRSGCVPRYRGILDCAWRIFTEQGFVRFFDGNLVSFLRGIPYQVLNPAITNKLKTMSPKYDPKTECGKYLLAHTLIGGLPSFISLLVVYPLDYVRTRLTSDVGPSARTYTGVVDCIVATARGPGGILALYEGFGLSIAGMIGYRFLQLGLFETITGLNPWRDDRGILGMLSVFCAAQVAVTTSAFATYPLDTVMRRLQVTADLPVSERAYHGTFDCFRRIMQEEGLSGLWAGFLFRTLRSISGAVVLIVYDRAKAYMAPPRHVPPAAHQAHRHTSRGEKAFRWVTFKPGRLGITYQREVGLVTSVEDASQGATAGILSGWIIAQVHDHVFTDKYLKAKVSGETDYEVRFLAPERGLVDSMTVHADGGKAVATNLAGEEIVRFDIPENPTVKNFIAASADALGVSKSLVTIVEQGRHLADDDQIANIDSIVLNVLTARMCKV